MEILAFNVSHNGNYMCFLFPIINIFIISQHTKYNKEKKQYGLWTANFGTLHLPLLHYEVTPCEAYLLHPVTFLAEMDHRNSRVQKLQHARDQIVQLETSYPLYEDVLLMLGRFTVGVHMKCVILLLAI